MVSEIEAESRARAEAARRPPLGRSAVLAQDPHLEPSRMKKGPAPLVQAAASSTWRALVAAYLRFVDAYREAASRLRRGVWDAEFPAGSSPPALPIRALERGG